MEKNVKNEVIYEEGSSYPENKDTDASTNPEVPKDQDS